MRSLLGLLLLTVFGWPQGSSLATRPTLLNAPLTRAGGLSACTTADGCVLDCGVGIATGNQTIWECVDGSGAAVAVTAGVGTVFESTGHAATPTAARINSDAQAPQLTSAAAFNSVWSGGDHTLVLIASPTTAVSANPILFSHGYFAESGIVAQGSGANFNVFWSGTGVNVSLPVAVSTVGRWSVMTARRSATTYTTRVNGTQATTTIGTVLATTADPMRFGRYRDVNRDAAGPLARARIYTRALSDVEVTRLEAGWWGATAETRNVSVARASTRWCPDDAGNIRAIADAAGCVNAKGLLVEEARTNYASASLSIDSAADWTVLATPTITADQASGPFARLNGGPEMDLLVDDDAANQEGVQARSVGGASAAVAYTASFYVAPGTSGTERNKASLWIDHNGTSALAKCDWAALNTGTPTCTPQTAAVCGTAETGLPGGVVRISCTTTITGAPTTVLGQIREGNVAADTGSILVAGGQVEAGGFASSPIVTATTQQLARAADVATMVSAGLPIAEGSWEADVTPVWSGTPAGNYFFLHAVRSSPTLDGPALYAVAGGLVLKGDVWVASTGPYSPAGSVAAWNAGTTYRVAQRWGANSLVYRNGAMIGTPAAVTGRPGGISAAVGVGNSQPTGQCNCYVRAIAVRP
jgi:hypothetical protein